MTYKKTILLPLLLLLAFAQGAGAQEYISFYADGDSRGLEDMDTYNGQEVSAFTLNGRTLYKDKSWNTLCLPFNVTITSGVLYGVEARTLSSATFTDGTLTLTFSDPVEELQAGVPYIIKWNSEDSDLENPSFGDVTLNTALNPVTTNEWIDFVGNYEAVTLSATTRTNLYLGTNNTLYYPSVDRTLGLCRAHFELKNGLTAGNPSSPLNARAFVLNFGDQSTGITALSTDFKDSKDNTAWFNLDGRRFSGKPAHAGVYINNGKKVVIK